MRAVIYISHRYPHLPDAVPSAHINICKFVHLPVLVTLTGEHRADVATAHGNDHLGRAHRLVGPRLGNLAADVGAPLSHRRDR